MTAPHAPHRRLLLAAAGSTLLGTLPTVRAQVPAGSGPIRLVVPFTPGTGIDLIARQIGPRLAERLGRPVVVDNRPGASGNLGTEAVVRAPADGSTLLVTVSTLVMNRALYPKLGFDALKDLEPVSLTSWGWLAHVPSRGR
jgi:tripartite-type tricarboxylate transporter receptor subunit TctC